MMSGDLDFTLTNMPDASDREYIHERIKAFNDRVSRYHRAVRGSGGAPLCIFVRDAQRRLVGGLTADTYWNWLEIDDLWLEEALRRRGLGRKLLSIAENEARRRGCTSAFLQTFSFQARGFYEKQGYRVVGQLDDYPPGEVFYWMRKDLTNEERIMTREKKGPAYRVETERLVIRCWNPTDAQLLQDAIEASLDHLRPWMSWIENEPQPLDAKIQLLRAFRAKFDRDEDFVYGVFDPDEVQVIGGTGLHMRRGEDAREIGYWIHVGHIKKGYATELSAALTKVAFELNDVRRVEIRCNVDNTASAAIPKKLGFTHEATRRRLLREADGTYCDTMIWTLLDDEYPNSPAADASIAAFDVFERQIL